MFCTLDDDNRIMAVFEQNFPPIEKHAVGYPWSKVGDIYIDVEPLEYAQQRYKCAVGAEFAKRRDEIRWVEIDGISYGFDCTTEDITNFMAAYTPLMFKQDGETGYKVWLDKEKKGLVMLNYAGMKKAYDTVRSSQLAAYAWYEDIKAKLLAVTEVEGKEKLEEVFPIGG